MQQVRHANVTPEQQRVMRMLFWGSGLELKDLSAADRRVIRQLIAKGYANLPSGTWARLTDEGERYIRPYRYDCQ